jgi:hypothetical protein
VVEKTRILDREFFAGFAAEKRLRRRIFHVLTSYTAKGNIQFTAFHKVAHATDATDWRVEYPTVVVYPDAVEEVPGLIRAARKLGLSVIPRGGGTGLTGGAIPVRRNTMVINTEKLNRISAIEIERSTAGTSPSSVSRRVPSRMTLLNSANTTAISLRRSHLGMGVDDRRQYRRKRRRKEVRDVGNRHRQSVLVHDC